MLRFFFEGLFLFVVVLLFKIEIFFKDDKEEEKEIKKLREIKFIEIVESMWCEY